MKAFVISNGDPNVGLFPMHGSIDLGFDPEPGQFKEKIREAIAVWFSDLWNDIVHVRFEDERGYE